MYTILSFIITMKARSLKLNFTSCRVSSANNTTKDAQGREWIQSSGYSVLHDKWSNNLWNTASFNCHFTSVTVLLHFCSHKCIACPEPAPTISMNLLSWLRKKKKEKIAFVLILMVAIDKESPKMLRCHTVKYPRHELSGMLGYAIQVSSDWLQAAAERPEVGWMQWSVRWSRKRSSRFLTSLTCLS